MNLSFLRRLRHRWSGDRSHASRSPLTTRSVWITYTDSPALTSRPQIRATLKNLAELGFNTIYPVVWQRGHTLYPSRAAQQAIGTATLPEPVFQERDMLAELLEAAQPYGFRVIPWLEYGLMAPPQSLLAQRHPDWLTRSTQSPQYNGMVWLHPAHPEVTAFLTALVDELVRHYPIDGIQLDDHWGWPSELGDDPFTRQHYQETTGQLPPSLPNPDWQRWRIDQLSNLMQQIAQQVRSSNPEAILSLSPNPYEFSRSKYLADWQHWLEQGWIDELVVQLYRDQLPALIAELSKPELTAARRRIPVSIGLLSGLRTKSVDFDRIEQQVQVVRDRGFTGVSFFFCETVIHQTLSPIATGDRVAQRWQQLWSS